MNLSLVIHKLGGLATTIGKILENLDVGSEQQRYTSDFADALSDMYICCYFWHDLVELLSVFP